MSPHEVDIDMKLVNSEQRLIDYSVFYVKEEMMNQVLDPGQYFLHIYPLSYNSLSSEYLLSCQSIIVEIAIAPVLKTQSRINGSHCPAYQILPQTFDFSPLQDSLEFKFDSDQDNNNRFFNIRNPSSSKLFVTEIERYSFTLPSLPGKNPLFHFTAALGYDFLTGGTLRLILVPGNTTANQCSTRDCIFGDNLVSNKNALITTMGPGNYSLLIVDNSRRRFQSLDYSCNFVSLQIDIKQEKSDENFLSCQEERIPTDLNDPGLLDDTGFLQFREEVFIDLSQTNHEIKFTLRAKSLFRVFVEAHRVDIDLELRNATSIIARTYRLAGVDESIMTELKPNVPYSLFIKYYTSLEAIFCETFLLEIGIEPSQNSYQVDYCTANSTSKPSLSLNSVSNAIFFPKSVYQQIFTVDTHIEKILSVPITVNSEMILEVSVGAYFLSGISLYIQNETKVTAKTNLNSLKLSTILLPNTVYTLVLNSGPSQSRREHFQLFPPCVYYDFELKLSSTSKATMLSCSAPSLPTSLAGPSFLGSSNRVHIRDDFLVKRVSGLFDSVESMSFTVRTPSLFRAVTTSSNQAQIYFSISEDNSILPHTESEDKLTVKLTPGTTYSFILSYYADFDLLPRCSSWGLELEIAPLSDLNPTSCESDVLPDSSLTLHIFIPNFNPNLSPDPNPNPNLNP